MYSSLFHVHKIFVILFGFSVLVYYQIQNLKETFYFLTTVEISLYECIFFYIVYRISSNSTYCRVYFIFTAKYNTLCRGDMLINITKYGHMKHNTYSKDIDIKENSRNL